MNRSLKTKNATSNHSSGNHESIAPNNSAENSTTAYAELHAHSNYSFQEGASEAWDLLLTAKQLGLHALAITDHDNVSGVMEFAQAAKELGIKPIIVDQEGNELDGACQGLLCITDSWPGQMRSIFGDHDRFISTYFSQYPGRYFTGDGARRDEDGYYWITGRVDDVINVSGHRMGTAEVESALVSHAKVAEAAVVGAPHEIKGQGIYAYVTLNASDEPSDELRAELIKWVRKEIGPIATPDWLQWAPGLPKTRSGKIMRRILRKIAENDFGNLGDTSTLADPAVVDDLVENRQNR